DINIEQQFVLRVIIYMSGIPRSGAWQDLATAGHRDHRGWRLDFYALCAAVCSVAQSGFWCAGHIDKRKDAPNLVQVTLLPYKTLMAVAGLLNRITIRCTAKRSVRRGLHCSSRLRIKCASSRRIGELTASPYTQRRIFGVGYEEDLCLISSGGRDADDIACQITCAAKLAVQSSE